MARDDRYITTTGVIGVLAGFVLDRWACWRKGHDPMSVETTILCRRCYATLP